MPEFYIFAVFMAGAIALNLTPGPDMTFVLAQSAHRGARAGMAAALGIGAGTFFHMALAALGLATVLAASPLAFDLVRYAGAAYLVWIAWGMVRHPPQLSDARADRAVGAAFRQGVLTNVFNPKVAMFFIAYLPQFISPDGGPAWQQILVLGLAFNVSGTLINCLVALGGGQLAQHLRARPGIGKVLGWGAGAVMVALAVRLAWPNRP